MILSTMLILLTVYAAGVFTGLVAPKIEAWALAQFAKLKAKFIKP